MTHPDPLQNHRKLCDELYQLALEENRFLKEQGRPPAFELVEKKRALLARLDESLAALRAASRDQPMSTEAQGAVEQTKARIMQFLHLDRENEQLLLRYSLAPKPPPVGPAATPTNLQRTYEQQKPGK
jgi:hypothetical protein